MLLVILVHVRSHVYAVSATLRRLLNQTCSKRVETELKAVIFVNGYACDLEIRYIFLFNFCFRRPDPASKSRFLLKLHSDHSIPITMILLILAKIKNLSLSRT